MIATTIEQSRRLLELGLDPDSADMEYCYIDEFNSGLQVKGDICRNQIYIEKQQICGFALQSSKKAASVASERRLLMRLAILLQRCLGGVI